MELWLELYPMIAPGAPFINKQLDAFEGNSVEGSPVEVLTDDELNRLEYGVGFLKVKDEKSKMALLIATVTKVSGSLTLVSEFFKPLPETCIKRKSVFQTLENA